MRAWQNCYFRMFNSYRLIFIHYIRQAASAMVTRFAPSPTGSLNIGGLYATLISERLAHQSNGVFYLRIEGTDKKREVTGSTENIINSLLYFGIHFDEGHTLSGDSKGNYGPINKAHE